jgi:hypothetical protein
MPGWGHMLRWRVPAEAIWMLQNHAFQGCNGVWEPTRVSEYKTAAAFRQALKDRLGALAEGPVAAETPSPGSLRMTACSSNQAAFAVVALGARLALGL